MLLIISSILVMLFTTISIIKVNKHKSHLGNMTGMAVVMVLGMASSLLAGIIAGIVFRGDLTISTIIAVVFSLITGVIAGRLISLLALVEGIAGGVMGGMMGAMLGEMLPANNYILMLVFTDILFIASFLSIILLINSELKKIKDNQEPIKIYPRTSPWILISVLSAVVIFTFAQLEAKTVHGKT